MGKCFKIAVLGTIEQSLVKLPPFGVCIVTDEYNGKARCPTAKGLTIKCITSL